MMLLLAALLSGIVLLAFSLAADPHFKLSGRYEKRTSYDD